MAETPSTTAIPVALLCAGFDLKEARGNQEATRTAAIRYFSNAVAAGYEVSPPGQLAVPVAQSHRIGVLATALFRTGML